MKPYGVGNWTVEEIAAGKAYTQPSAMREREVAQDLLAMVGRVDCALALLESMASAEEYPKPRDIREVMAVLSGGVDGPVRLG